MNAWRREGGNSDEALSKQLLCAAHMGGDLKRIKKGTRQLEEGSRRFRRQAGRKAWGRSLLVWMRLSKATGA